MTSKGKLVVYDSQGNAPRPVMTKADLELAVRKTNPAELNTAPPVFWDAEDTLKTGAIDNSNLKQQLTIVESGVLYSAKLYNDLKVKNDMLAKQLKRKLDNLDEQRRNFESLNAMKKTETDESIRIEELKKEVLDIEDEILRHSHYSRQLDHLLLRLRNNQLKFDSHMVTMEQTMPSILKEQEDVSHLRRCLGVALGKASLVLQETKANLAVARKDREALMRKRLDEVKNAEMLQDWMRRRKEAKMNLAIELRGDLTQEEEKFLMEQIKAKVEETKTLQRESEAGLKMLHELETFFAKLKQVTGVASSEHMAEKFSMQKMNKIELEKEVSEVERKLLNTKKELQQQEKLFQDLKSHGVGPTDLSRTITDNLESEIDNARAEQKLAQAQSERLAATLLDLQQGSNGLLQRLLPFGGEITSDTGSGFELGSIMDDSSGPKTLISTLEALSHGEVYLAKMLEMVTAGSENAMNMSTSHSHSQHHITNGNSSGSLDDDELEELLETGGVNIRVKSRKNARNGDGNGTGESKVETVVRSREKRGKAFDRNQEDILSREAVKFRSEKLMKEETIRRAREMKKNTLLKQSARRKTLSTAMTSTKAAAPSGPATNSGGNANGATTATAGDDDEDGKLTADMEFRILAMNLAAKEQREYCKKLSTPGNVLADAVNVRSDVMAKVNAFFDRKPELD